MKKNLGRTIPPKVVPTSLNTYMLFNSNPKNIKLQQCKVGTRQQRKPRNVEQSLPKTEANQKLGNPIDANRQTRISKLSSVALGLASLRTNTFGALRFDLSKDPAKVKIKDQTGDYKLVVPFDCLREFQLDVLVGKDECNRPNVTVLIGDCQCYPELPECIVSLCCETDCGKNPSLPSIEANRMSNKVAKMITAAPGRRGWTNNEKSCTTITHSCSQVDKAHGGGDVCKDPTEAVPQGPKVGEDARKRLKRGLLPQKSKEDFSAYRNNLNGFIKLLVEEGEYDFETTNVNQIEGKKHAGVVGGHTMPKKPTDDGKTSVSRCDQSTSTRDFQAEGETETPENGLTPAAHRKPEDNIADCKTLVKDILQKLNQWEDCQAESIANICNPRLTNAGSESDMESSSANFDTVKRMDEEFEDASSSIALEPSRVNSLERFFNSLAEEEEIPATDRKLGCRKELDSKDSPQDKFEKNYGTVRQQETVFQNESINILWKSFYTAFLPSGIMKNMPEHARKKLKKINEHCIRSLDLLFSSSMADSLQRIKASEIPKPQDVQKSSIPSRRTISRSPRCSYGNSFESKDSTGAVQRENDRKLDNFNRAEDQSLLGPTGFENDKPQKPRIFFNAKPSLTSNYIKM